MSVHARHQQLKDDQRQFFDELITEEWDTYRSDAWDFTRRFEIARLLRTLRPHRVLDIGCGCGFHDVEIAAYPFVERVDAIDYSSASIVKANEAYPHLKVGRRVGDLFTDTPEPNYDLVVSFQVIEHLRDPGVYFRYACGACRPGGAIAVVTPNGRRFDNRIRKLRGEPPAMIDPQHFHEYSIGELRALGVRHGLEPVDTFGYGFQSWLVPALSPKDFRRATRLGSWLPSLANIIGVVFRKPETA